MNRTFYECIKFSRFESEVHREETGKATRGDAEHDEALSEYGQRLYSLVSGTKVNVLAGKNHCQTNSLAAFLYFCSSNPKRNVPAYFASISFS